MTRVNILKGLTVFLIRKKLGLKNNESFIFSNQKSKDVYWFDKGVLWKHGKAGNSFLTRKSDVGLNWLLNDKCKIEKLADQNQT